MRYILGITVSFFSTAEIKSMAKIASSKANTQIDGIDRRLSVAPMMDWTDRHCRYFHRLLAPHALLFTEMVTAEAILHAGADRFCAHDAAEAPLALQLGGSDPTRLAAAVEAVRPYEFAEINLNVGCPSDRVQSGRFGACLMAEPELVAECLAAMADVSTAPVTVKCRIGIDDMDPITGLDRFVDAVAEVGTKHIYLHARKAWLKGLSPKENRDIPPLDYNRAADLAERRPDLHIYLNGGLVSCPQICTELERFEGVMIGRAAYKTPYLLAELSAALYDAPLPDRYDIACKMAEYARSQLDQGARLHNITRHMLGLYAGQKGARVFRRHLGEEARQPDADPMIIEQAAAFCVDANDRKVA